MQVLTGGWGEAPVVRKISDVRTYGKDLVGSDTFPQVAWDVLEFLEGIEDDYPPYYSEVKVGPLRWMQYHKEKSLPQNFIAVGDASMKLNPIWGSSLRLGLAYCTDDCLS